MSQKTANDMKGKHLVLKSNSNTTNMSSKNKKSKPNNSRNESTSNGCVAPKKPINPYLLFCQENRTSVQEKYQIKHKVNKWLIPQLLNINWNVCGIRWKWHTRNWPKHWHNNGINYHSLTNRSHLPNVCPLINICFLCLGLL